MSNMFLVTFVNKSKNGSDDNGRVVVIDPYAENSVCTKSVRAYVIFLIPLEIPNS